MADLNLFRAPKRSANYNAYRTLVTGIIGALLIFVLMPQALVYWDQYGRDVPWIWARLEVTPAPQPYGVIVRDTVTATVPVSGIRHIWVESESGLRVCPVAQRHDNWPTVPGETEHQRLWSFAAFTQGCQPPEPPFRVCTSFAVETARGVQRPEGPFCSEIYRG